MSEELVMKQLKRLESLLHPERTRGALEKTGPELPPDELGALAGVGYRAHNPDVQASVYIFPNGSRHFNTSEQLKQKYAQDGVYVLTGSNGPMLFVGHTRIDGKDGMAGKYRLGDIASAFAGDE